MTSKQKKRVNPKTANLPEHYDKTRHFSREKTNLQPAEPCGEQNISKQKLETKDRSQLILVCAFVFWMTIIMIERIFIKDDVLLQLFATMLSLIVGYHFGRSQNKEVA